MCEEVLQQPRKSSFTKTNVILEQKPKQKLVEAAAKAPAHQPASSSRYAPPPRAAPPAPAPAPSAPAVRQAFVQQVKALPSEPYDFGPGLNPLKSIRSNQEGSLFGACRCLFEIRKLVGFLLV